MNPRLVVANSLVRAGFNPARLSNNNHAFGRALIRLWRIKPAPTLAKRIVHPVSKGKLGVFVQILLSLKLRLL